MLFTDSQALAKATDDAVANIFEAEALGGICANVFPVYPWAAILNTWEYLDMFDHLDARGVRTHLPLVFFGRGAMAVAPTE